jgi:carbon storage regulator CsrA
MLVLSRKKNQGILIKGKDGDIRIVVLEADKGKLRLGIDASQGYVILREELIVEIKDANKRSALEDLDNIKNIMAGDQSE